MVQVNEMTREQKIEMFMKVSKREVIELLLNNQEMLQNYLRIHAHETNQSILTQDTRRYPFYFSH